MAGPRKKLLLPATMRRAGWDVLAARRDVEAVPFEVNIAPEAFHRLLADAHGVGLSLTPFGEAEARAAPHLQVVARHGVGYDLVDVPALTRHRLPLMVTGTANSPSVAEQALHFMFAFAKRSAALDAMVREKRWSQRLAEPLPIDLFQKTLLVVGFGRIGTRIAKACLALGMKVRVYDPYVPAATVVAAGGIAEPDLDGALPHADFVTIHCPKNTETTGMFGATRLGRMKPTAYLINTARGAVIDEAALLAAVQQKVIAGAALDVLTTEPPPPGHPLMGQPGIILTPHAAFYSEAAIEELQQKAAEHVAQALRGEWPDNVVNPQVRGQANYRAVGQAG